MHLLWHTHKVLVLVVPPYHLYGRGFRRLIFLTCDLESVLININVLDIFYKHFFLSCGLSGWHLYFTRLSARSLVSFFLAWDLLYLWLIILITVHWSIITYDVVTLFWTLALLVLGECYTSLLLVALRARGSERLATQLDKYFLVLLWVLSTQAPGLCALFFRSFFWLFTLFLKGAEPDS